MKKKAIILMLGLVMAVSLLSGCGNKKTAEDYTMDELDAMNEDELEEVLENTLEKWDEESETEKVSEEIEETEAEMESVYYAPMEEIINADFGSMLLQINDVILDMTKASNGEMTVLEVIEVFQNSAEEYTITINDTKIEDYNMDRLLNGNQELKIADAYGNKILSFRYFPMETVTLEQLQAENVSVSDYVDTFYDLVESGRASIYYPGGYSPVGLDANGNQITYQEAKSWMEQVNEESNKLWSEGWKKYTGDDVENDFVVHEKGDGSVITLTVYGYAGWDDEEGFGGWKYRVISMDVDAETSIVNKITFNYRYM